KIDKLEQLSHFRDILKLLFIQGCRRDRIVVSTLRCGRNNPGSNPGHGI
ncbi:hypothetical protein NPIL_604451, partial [Nephila pilipes]